MINLVVDDAGINAAYFHLERLAFFIERGKYERGGAQGIPRHNAGDAQTAVETFFIRTRRNDLRVDQGDRLAHPAFSLLPELDDCHSLMHANLRRG